MPPVVIAAGIGAAAGIGGAALSASAQKKAAKSAANTAQNTANANNALARENREFSAARLDPYAQRGNQAGDAINALLGLGGAPQQAMQGPQQFGEPMGIGGMASGQAPGGDSYGLVGNIANQLGAGYGANAMARAQPYSQGDISRMWTDGIKGNARAAEASNARMIQGQPQQAGSPYVSTTTPQTAQNAFQNYLNSAGYQFQVDQGNQAINQGYAARGSLQSGAALKALQTYGQNTATGFFKDYLGLLANQQGVGLSGASAVAGVGQNYVNSVSSNNNNAASVQGNAALAQGNAQAQMYGNIAGAIGGVANAFGSSYGR